MKDSTRSFFKPQCRRREDLEEEKRQKEKESGLEREKRQNEKALEERKHGNRDADSRV